MTDDFAFLDATAQAELVRTGDVSPLELVDAAINRVEKLNPELNAVIHTRFDEARQAARGELPDGPFKGVPTLFKDLGCAIAGEPYHEGMQFLKGAGYRSPHTDNLATKYFEAAGMKGGKYSGPNGDVTLTCDNADPGKAVCAVAADQLRGLGFKPKIQSVPHEKMLLICGIPSKQPEVCPNVGWFKDFYDPQTMLQNTFQGSSIVPENNSNWPQLDDPKINAAREEAAQEKDVAARAKAWGEIDKQIVATAPGVPFVWDRQPDAESKDVAGVVSEFLSVWDLSFTALK